MTQRFYAFEILPTQILFERSAAKAKPYNMYICFQMTQQWKLEERVKMSTKISRTTHYSVCNTKEHTRQKGKADKGTFWINLVLGTTR